jgi:NodT family efflux transporter outer membrane factor (OMF) lipoprotein
MLGGCAPVGPTYERPDVAVEPAWLNTELGHYQKDGADLAEWWRTFNDPVLDRLIDTAYENNNTLKIAGLRILESQSRLNVATGNKYPQVQVATGDATAVGTSKNSANSESRDLSFVQYNLGAALSWEIDFWGRFRRGIEAADAGLLATLAEYDDLLVLLTAQVADVYILIRTTEEQLELAQDSVEIQRRSYEIAEVLYRNGEDSELDAIQAETLLLSTEAVIPGLEIALAQTKNALSVLLGITSADVDPLLQGEPTLLTPPEQIGIGVPADLLRQRPDVRAAEMRARAQNALVGVATANLYPSFSLVGTLGLSSTENTSGVGELFSSDSFSYAAGASFVWPFLNYGRIRNNIAVEDARLQQALIAYQEAVLQAAAETESALAAYSGTRKQDEILRRGVIAAERSSELSLLRYQEGFSDYQRVLNAQQSLFSQQQRYASTRGDVFRSLIAIYRSLGGGWQTQ